MKAQIITTPTQQLMMVLVFIRVALIHMQEITNPWQQSMMVLVNTITVRLGVHRIGGAGEKNVAKIIGGGTRAGDVLSADLLIATEAGILLYDLRVHMIKNIPLARLELATLALEVLRAIQLR